MGHRMIVLQRCAHGVHAKTRVADSTLDISEPEDGSAANGSLVPWVLSSLSSLSTPSSI
jgi:hypothetical protein